MLDLPYFCLCRRRRNVIRLNLRRVGRLEVTRPTVLEVVTVVVVLIFLLGIALIAR